MTAGAHLLAAIKWLSLVRPVPARELWNEWLAASDWERGDRHWLQDFATRISRAMDP